MEVRIKRVMEQYEAGIITYREVIIRLIQEAVNRSPQEIAKDLSQSTCNDIKIAVKEGNKRIYGAGHDTEKESKLYNEGLKKWGEWFGFVDTPISKFEDLIGREIIYKSESGKEYVGVITAIPERPEHGCSDLPTVSLMFKDNRNKHIKKERVLPASVATIKTQVYYLHPSGKYWWKDGLFTDEEPSKE